MWTALSPTSLALPTPGTPEDYTCMRCHGINLDAMQLECGHSMCGTCARPGVTVQCCDKVTTSPSPNLAFRRLITNLVVLCGNQCGAQIMAKDLNDHLDACPGQMFRCLNTHTVDGTVCGFKSTADGKETHKATCPFDSLLCEIGCGAPYARKDRDQHVHLCPDCGERTCDGLRKAHTVTCPGAQLHCAMCGDYVARRDVAAHLRASPLKHFRRRADGLKDNSDEANHLTPAISQPCEATQTPSIAQRNNKRLHRHDAWDHMSWEECDEFDATFRSLSDGQSLKGSYVYGLTPEERWEVQILYNASFGSSSAPKKNSAESGAEATTKHGSSSQQPKTSQGSSSGGNGNAQWPRNIQQILQQKVGSRFDSFLVWTGELRVIYTAFPCFVDAGGGIVFFPKRSHSASNTMMPHPKEHYLRDLSKTPTQDWKRFIDKHNEMDWFVGVKRQDQFKQMIFASNVHTLAKEGAMRPLMAGTLRDPNSRPANNAKNGKGQQIDLASSGHLRKVPRKR